MLSNPIVAYQLEHMFYSITQNGVVVFFWLFVAYIALDGVTTSANRRVRDLLKGPRARLAANNRDHRPCAFTCHLL